jgi:glyoxylase-like metal-dependent hydrolase (beta-lactamase superfamily II)
MAHKNDIHIIEDISKMYEYYHVSNDPEQIELFNAILQGLRLKNTPIDTILSDNDIIKINDFYKLQVIHTPGHTKGHCCFYEKNSKIIFLADIDLSSFGPWYGCKDSNIVEFRDSIEKLKALPIEIAVSAHKGIIDGSNNIQNQLDEYLKKIDQREEKILKLLSEDSPKSLEDLANKNIVYPSYSEYKIYEILAEKIMIKSHLSKLLKENKITQENKGYILI